VEVVVEGAVGHELVHEDALAAVGAEAEEADEVLVVDAGEQRQLGDEGRLVVAARAPRRRGGGGGGRAAGVAALGALDGDLAAVGEGRAVHGAEAAGADAVGRREAARCGPERRQGELLHRRVRAFGEQRAEPALHARRRRAVRLRVDASGVLRAAAAPPPAEAINRHHRGDGSQHSRADSGAD